LPTDTDIAVDQPLERTIAVDGPDPLPVSRDGTTTGTATRCWRQRPRWSHVLSLLGHFYQVLAPDLPGYNAAPRQYEENLLGPSRTLIRLRTKLQQ
jgi:pimeloyl-ACP methyl ester carboxylesterase